MKQYLIVKTSAFGDVVQAFVVLQYIKSIEPEAAIDWVVEEPIAPLVRAHPLVREVIPIRTKTWKKKWWHPRGLYEAYNSVKTLRTHSYDAIFDLQGNAKSGLITLFAKGKDKVGFGKKTVYECLNCLATSMRFDPPQGQNAREEYLFIIRKYFNKDEVVPSILEEVSLRLLPAEKESLENIRGALLSNAWMIAPGSAWKNKQLSFDTLVTFLQLIQNSYKPFFVFLSGSDAELEENKKLQEKIGSVAYLLHRPSLPLLQHIMQGMELIISMDSLPLHLAATTKTPTFSFFGPSVSAKFRPLGAQHHSYQGSCPYGYTFERRCPSLRTCPTGACLREVSAEVLFQTFMSVSASEI